MSYFWRGACYCEGMKSLKLLAALSLFAVLFGAFPARAQSYAYRQKVQATRSASLLAYWPLDETSGGTAFDLSGNLRHAAYCVSPAAPALGSGVFWDQGVAPRFDGGDCVNAFTSSLSSVFDGNEGTISLWFRPFDGSVWTDTALRRFATFTSASHAVIVQRATNAGSTIAGIRVATTTASVTSNTPNVAWYHVVFTWRQSFDPSIAFYLNGSRVGSVPQIAAFSGPLTGAVLGAGTTAGGNGWNGYLAHVAVWNASLSESEIANLAQVSNPTPTPSATATITPTPTNTSTPTPTATPTPNYFVDLTLPSGQQAAVDFRFGAGEWLLVVLSVLQGGLLLTLVILFMTGRRK